jgi:hypothetical protein
MKPTVYVATGKLLITALPALSLSPTGIIDDTLTSPSRADGGLAYFVELQTEILESGELLRLTDARMRELHLALPERKVATKVVHEEGSPTLTIRASGSESKYVGAYLQAFLDEYIAFIAERKERDNRWRRSYASHFASTGVVLVEDKSVVVIAERPASAVPDAPDLLLPVARAATLGMGGGLVLILMAATFIAVWCGRPKQPKVMAA